MLKVVSAESMKIRWNSDKLNFDNFGVEIFENFYMSFCIVWKSKIIFEICKPSLYSVLYLVLSSSEGKSWEKLQGKNVRWKDEISEIGLKFMTKFI